MNDWKPTASHETLLARATLIARIRKFFEQRQVLEVQTPLLAPTTATDPHIQSLEVSGVLTENNTPYYLQTSPEFAMKRLLASGSGPIFQICKAFRQDEKSKRHNPEFTMLEWYRPGLSMNQLMDEVEQLVRQVCDIGVISKLSYRELFFNRLALDPHHVSLQELLSVVNQHVQIDTTTLSKDDCLHLLLSHVIEADMPANCFVFDYPASQAALAKIENDEQGVKVGKRFELFLSNMEIANGYFELTDASEQARRFDQDNRLRAEAGFSEYPVDKKLLAALEAGMPACSGVALGIDRLMMVAFKLKHIDQVLSFPLE